METIVEFFFHTLDLLPLALGRITAVLLMVPFLRQDFLTRMIFVGLGMSCMLPVLDTILPEERGNTITWTVLMLMVIKEVFVGVMIGYGLCIPFYAAQIAGNLIDQQRGASNVIMNDSMVGTKSTPYGSLLYHLCVVIFVCLGGLKHIIATVYESFVIWPVNRFIPAFDARLIDFGCQLFEHLVWLGLMLGAPAAIACFIVDFGMGLLNRVASGLNVYIMAMPIKSGMSALMVLLFLFSFLFVIKRELFPVDDILGMLKAVLTNV